MCTGRKYATITAFNVRRAITGQSSWWMKEWTRMCTQMCTLLERLSVTGRSLQLPGNELSLLLQGPRDQLDESDDDIGVQQSSAIQHLRHLQLIGFSLCISPPVDADGYVRCDHWTQVQLRAVVQNVNHICQYHSTLIIVPANWIDEVMHMRTSG